MATTKVILHGGGGHARVVADSLLAQGIIILGYFALEQSEDMDIPYLGIFAGQEHMAPAVIAIGGNDMRKELAGKLTTCEFANAIHPSAIISPFAMVGSGCMILHRCVVQAKTRIGNHVILNTSSQVDHDCVINDFVHICPGSILCGNVTVGIGTLVGAGSTILPGVKIGEWATLGAGSVVLHDIPDHAVAFGNPAKLITNRKP